MKGDANVYKKVVRGSYKMDCAKNIEIIKNLQEDIWNKGKIELINLYYHKNFIAHTPVGEWIGPDNVKNVVIDVRSNFPDWNEKLEDIFAFEDRVVLRYTSTGTHLGSNFFNIPPTGKKVTVPEISIFKLKNDKAIEHWDSWDLFGWFKQLGINIKLNK
jgi:predicted ester cyclase